MKPIVKNQLIITVSLTVSCLMTGCQSKEKKADGQSVTVACYYFPNYHTGEQRHEAAKGSGWSEWELIKAARPRFEGHAQPKIPAWGYLDESDPLVMEKKIDAAADHGIDAFIFDWYYYDDEPFLNRCLDNC